VKNAQRKLVVLISGRGSNMQTIHRATMRGEINARIVAVVSNNPDAAGLNYAAEQGLETLVLDHKGFASREAFDQQLIDHIDVFEPDYLILAGFMRILSAPFVEHYHGRLLNIHPSLLPKYKGLHTHRRALQNNEAEHGASVHFVTPDLDDGPVIMQARVPVLATDTEDSLMQSVLKMEHKLYPAAIALLCDGLVAQEQGFVSYHGKKLETPLVMT